MCLGLLNYLNLLLNRQLETMDDFDDEVQDARDFSNGHARSSKLSDLLVASKGNKLKV